MATQARAQLSVATGGTISIAAAEGYKLIDATNLPALVTEADELVEFDVPAHGKLRYQGPLPKKVSLVANLSTQAPGVTPVNFSYRIAKNGTSLERSEQIRSQSQLGGHTGVSLSGLVSVVTGDVLQLAIAVSADADLEIVEASMVVQETLTDVPLETVGSAFDWTALEDQLNQAIAESQVAEQVIYSPVGGLPVALRGSFDLAGYEADLERGVRVATGIPTFGFRDQDLGRPAAKGDKVAVSGRNYEVASVLPDGRGWSRCQLHDA